MTVVMLPLAIIAGLLRTQAQALLYRLSTRRRRTALRYAHRDHGSPADPKFCTRRRPGSHALQIPDSTGPSIGKQGTEPEVTVALHWQCKSEHSALQLEHRGRAGDLGAHMRDPVTWADGHSA